MDNDSEHFQRLERMVVVLYDRMSSAKSGAFFADAIELWIEYHPHKMHCFNALCTKLKCDRFRFHNQPVMPRVYQTLLDLHMLVYWQLVVCQV